jgi:hypothetical protein
VDVLLCVHPFTHEKTFGIFLSYAEGKELIQNFLKVLCEHKILFILGKHLEVELLVI